MSKDQIPHTYPVVPTKVKPWPIPVTPQDIATFEDIAKSIEKVKKDMDNELSLKQIRDVYTLFKEYTKDSKNMREVMLWEGKIIAFNGQCLLISEYDKYTNDLPEITDNLIKMVTEFSQTAEKRKEEPLYEFEVKQDEHFLEDCIYCNGEGVHSCSECGNEEPCKDCEESGIQHKRIKFLDGYVDGYVINRLTRRFSFKWRCNRSMYRYEGESKYAKCLLALRTTVD